MIAEPNRHIQTETLRELLDDDLPRDQTDRVQSHLDTCEHCRSELAEIAGEQQWWDETVGVLSGSGLIAPRREVNAGASSGEIEWSLDPSLEWIRPLLDESSDSDLGVIGQYPVTGLIGQGGMGVVLRGVDPALNRPVAIKILSPHLAGVGAARARFMREAQAAAAVVHPSIVPIYSIATTARLPYIVMPCISGGNLQERIDRDGPLELAEVLRIGLQIAEGLQAAHRNGVIHRDIKPANILVEEGNGRVLISDFGLARALDDATLTMSGMIAGTPQYMSPEQACGVAVDERSDLFSLGSLIYALATGRPPFRAETPLAVLRKISESTPRPIQQVNERMPAWLDQIVARLMTKDRTKRIASAGEISELLREAVAHVRNPTQQALPKSLSARRHRTRIAAGVALACVATVGGVLAIPPLAASFSKGGDPSPADALVLESGPQEDHASSFSLPNAQPDAVLPVRAEPAHSAALDSTDWGGYSFDQELAEVNGRITAIESQLETSHPVQIQANSTPPPNVPSRLPSTPLTTTPGDELP